jgi:hypothetical protein
MIELLLLGRQRGIPAAASSDREGSGYELF